MNAVRMLRGRRRPVALVAVAVVAFAFWRSLFAGGSLVSADIVATAPPLAAHQEVGFTPENGPGDPINIHSHWASWAADVRSGDISWWDRDLAGGQPTFKGGLPPFNLLYLIVPAWYAPGLVAAVRTLVAIGLTAGWLRIMGTSRVAGLVGGLAYGFSGFMVGWMNWPHSSVAALAPGVFWAIEAALRDPRPWRAVPLGLVTAAMVWSNFPQATYYVALAALVYAAFRVPAETSPTDPRRLRSWAVVAGAALVIALAIASPHLVGFSGYLDWADTSQRIGNPADSAAGTEYLMTGVAPALFGSDAVGPSWFGAGNWVEFQIHIGASVVLLAFAGAVRLRPRDRRRRAAVRALIAIAVLGVLIAYVGGPISVAVQEVAGDQIGLATRAKLMISLSVALLAGLGADAWSQDWDQTHRHAIARSVRRGTLVLAVIAIAFVPDLLDWRDMARRAGVTREVLTELVVPAIAAVGVVTAFWARWKGWIAPAATGWIICAVVTFELLTFAMPVPTTADRSQRLVTTEAHEQVVEMLEPGERLAGEGRTFFPNTTELHGIDDARGALLKSPGYQALLRAVDPLMLQLEGGGTPTYPNVQIDTDATSPVWDAMAVGAWAQFNSTVPPGEQVRPGVAKDIVDATAEPLSATFVVPEGGLRAVMFEVFLRGIPTGRIHMTIDIGGDVRRSQADAEFMQTGFAAVAFAGEDLPAGATGHVSFSAEGPPDEIMVAVDESGQLNVGTVSGGEDGLTLVRAGDVTILERSTTRFARLHDAATVLGDVDAAAEYVAASRGPRPAVVDRDVGLPASPAADAQLAVQSLDVDPGRVEVATSADRPALLVVSQVVYDGWRVEIDGRSADLITADAAFTGVVVPAGEHTVVFRFRPDHVTWTVGLAIAAIVGSVILLATARRRAVASDGAPGR